jgi:hypothetical protein
MSVTLHGYTPNSVSAHQWSSALRADVFDHAARKIVLQPDAPGTPWGAPSSPRAECLLAKPVAPEPNFAA